MNPLSRLLRHRLAGRERAVSFCDSCGQVCTAACRTDAALDQVRVQALHLGRLH